MHLHCTAQTFKPKTPMPVAADCKSAIQININKITSYGPTVAPAGFGEVQEISEKNSKGRLFEKEHHTAWYLLNINQDGELVFNIIPEDSLNDYDFVFFEYDSNFCERNIQKNIMPLRSNISRNDTTNKSVTGLSNDAMEDHHRKGIGNQFSRSVMVKKGKKYMLVLDNVYDNGKGHTIKFNYMRDVIIGGIVTSVGGKPLAAEVLLTDNKGNEVVKAMTDTSGKYRLDLSLMDSVNYILSFSNDSTFVSSHMINTVNIPKDSPYVALKTIMYKLKKGAKYPLKNINFIPGFPELLPESFGAVESLYKLMKKNKKMKILIEGHVNAPWVKDEEASEKSLYDLSYQRSQTVQKYLTDAGIAADRISIKGLAATRMLFPHAKTEEEQKANRRVEIKVTALYED